MADAPLTTADAVVAKLLRPLTDLEADYIGENIADASDQLRDRMPTVDERIAQYELTPRPDTALSPTKVANVLAGAIAKFLVNPRGLWSRSDTDGPHSASETYPGARGGEDAAGSSLGPRLTDADVAELNRRSTGPRIGTIRLRSGML